MRDRETAHTRERDCASEKYRLSARESDCASEKDERAEYLSVLKIYLSVLKISPFAHSGNGQIYNAGKLEDKLGE